MDEYLFAGESVIETKGANFLLYLDEYGLPRFGLFGLDAQLLLTGLPEKTESLGGKLYLTNYRLFFQSHRFNRFKGTFSIYLSDISEVKDISQSLTLGKVMQVITRSHNFEFVVWKIPKLITAITDARNSILPAQIEELRNAVHRSPEKCGDGMKIFPPELITGF